PRPRFETRMVGRRPNRSDKTPSIGEKKNCIAAKTVPKTPFQSAALFMSPPRKSRINFGSTGTMRPTVSISSVTVTRTKMTAALVDFIAALLRTGSSGFDLRQRWFRIFDPIARRGHIFLFGDRDRARNDFVFCDSRVRRKVWALPMTTVAV